MSESLFLCFYISDILYIYKKCFTRMHIFSYNKAWNNMLILKFNHYISFEGIY